MKSDSLRQIHIGVNTDPFDIDEEEEIHSKRSQTKWTLRDDIQHVQISNSNILHEAYTFEELLGQGSFGRVVAVSDKSNNKSWAMKIIPKALVPAKINAIRREIQILKLVKHPHIIFLHKIFESHHRIYLVLEKCTGELGQLFKKCKPFSEADTKVVIIQLAGVVDYLHKNDIVHRDLKLENILLAPNPTNSNDNLYIKVTDFGLGIVKGAYHEMLHDRCGTLTYLSPEIITKGSYSHQCDVWAMGVIMYLLLYGRYPFYAPVEQKLIKLICDYDPDYSHITASDAAIHLISKMLTKDPALRITAAEVKYHAWIVGSPLEESKNENVLEMMKMWRSDMMLPQGTDCDWVNPNLSSTSTLLEKANNNDQDSDNLSQTQSIRSGRKQSLKIPIHNIEFNRIQRDLKPENNYIQKAQISKAPVHNQPIRNSHQKNARRDNKTDPSHSRYKKNPHNKL